LASQGVEAGKEWDMVLRWIVVLKVAGALLFGAFALGSTSACGTIEGVGKDISDAARFGKRVFD
jgi:predicted small secreted protein